MLGPPSTVPPANIWPRRVATVAGLFAVISGLITLYGWAAGIERLTAWKNDGISMFPNTAACALLSGLTLWLGNNRPRQAWRALVLLLPAIVSLLAALTLAEHVTGANWGLDTLLFEPAWGQRAAAAPMRMGPPASIAFLMTGAALLLSNFGPRARSIGATLGVIVIAVAMLSLTGHLYGAQQMYTLPHLTGIALQSASIIFALGIGVLASLPDQEPVRAILERSAAGMLARRTLPVIIVVAFALGWGRLVLQNYGLVDTEFGTALRTILELIFFSLLLWSAIVMVRTHEQALRKSEKEVRRQAGQLAAFLETAAICLHRVGPDGTILWANDAELQTFGYHREEYFGHHIAEFHVDRVVIDDILARLHGGEKLREWPAQMKCKDGSIKDVLIDSSVFWDEGRFVHTQCFTRDITASKRIAAEREEAARRKDEFIAILAHELRNPLAPVRNAVHYLKRKAAGEPDFEKPVEMIERQVAQMSRLIDDLLDLSRISRGVLELRRRPVVLAEVVEAALDACHDEIQSRGHRLRSNLPDEPVVLDADRERLVQLLSNVIGNAAKYTAPGGEIELEVTPGDGTVQITVKDNGIGIPPGKLTEIFELFARVDESLERQGGLGIGLTLARQIADLHGGTIVARSPGISHGSEFTIALPILQPSLPIAAQARSRRPVSPTRRILVADDNRDAAESLALLLQLNGHDVHAVFDGEAAISSAESLLPEVALLDIGMPKANGYEVARRIRDQPWGKHMYLVALTGWGQDADKRRAHEVGFDAHLVKPVPPEAIDEILAKIRTPAKPLD